MTCTDITKTEKVEKPYTLLFSLRRIEVTFTASLGGIPVIVSIIIPTLPKCVKVVFWLAKDMLMQEVEVSSYCEAVNYS